MLTELEQPESSYDIELLAFSADGTLLASGNANGQIQFWEQDGGKFTSPKSITKGNTTSLAFTPTNNLLAIGVVDSLVLIDPATLEEYTRIPVTGAVNSISFSSNGTSFMTSSLRALQFWDLTKIQQIKQAGIVETACRHLLENLSQDQWDLLFKDEEYKPLCENLPVPAP
jgi:WD40 repeat protein